MNSDVTDRYPDKVRYFGFLLHLYKNPPPPLEFYSYVQI